MGRCRCGGLGDGVGANVPKLQHLHIPYHHPGDHAVRETTQHQLYGCIRVFCKTQAGALAVAQRVDLAVVVLTLIPGLCNLALVHVSIFIDGCRRGGCWTQNQACALWSTGQSIPGHALSPLAVILCGVGRYESSCLHIIMAIGCMSMHKESRQAPGCPLTPLNSGCTQDLSGFGSVTTGKFTIRLWL